MTFHITNQKIRPDSKLNFPGQVERDAEHRSTVDSSVHEHPGTGNNRTIDPEKQFRVKSSDESKRVYVTRLWPYRLLGNILILALLALASLGIIILKTNYVGQKLSSLSDYFYDATSYLGFGVDDILVYGRIETSPDEINNIINTRHGDNILKIDIHQLKADLEQLPWVKSATVQRSYFPNILEINLVEKQVQSLWQINGVFYPIDTDGQVIDSQYIPSEPMLVIIGSEAPAHFGELLKIIKEDNELYQHIKAAGFIAGRRWNILIDDGQNPITIKLPYDTPDQAWKKLIKLNKTQSILKRKLTIIDLRFRDKVLVKPRKLSAEEKLNQPKTNI